MDAFAIYSQEYVIHIHRVTKDASYVPLTDGKVHKDARKLQLVCNE
jgi:hypothetical protein